VGLLDLLIDDQDRSLGEKGRRQLFNRFVAGRDEAAFSAFFACHAYLVMEVCGRMLGNAEDT
jgi:hypothetical protein